MGKSLLDAFPSDVKPAWDDVRRELAAFWIRRGFRIVPLAVLGGLLALALTPAFALIREGRREVLLANLWSIATLRINYQMVASFPGHPLAYYWSLVVEEHFYLVAPWLLLLLPRRSARLLLCGGLVGAVALVFRPATLVEADAGRAVREIRYSTHLAIDFLAAGVGLALLRSASGRPAGPTWWARALVVPAVAVVFGVGRSAPGDVRTIGMPLVLAASVYLVWAAQTARGIVSLGPLDRALEWLGGRSYGWYLLHFPLMLLAMWVVPRTGARPWLVTAATLTMTAAAAELTYRLVERPLIRVGVGVSQRVRRVPQG